MSIINALPTHTDGESHIIHFTVSEEWGSTGAFDDWEGVYVPPYMGGIEWASVESKGWTIMLADINNIGFTIVSSV